MGPMVKQSGGGDRGAQLLAERASALRIAHQAYVQVQGRNAYTGTGKELLADPDVRKIFLGR